MDRKDIHSGISNSTFSSSHLLLLYPHHSRGTQSININSTNSNNPMSIWSSENNAGSIASSIITLGTAAATLMLYQSYRNSLPNNNTSPIVRPDLVLDALEHNKQLYYFGVGSNLSRKKLEGRSICGKKIHVLSMEPCIIPNHRLAFNTRGFPPLEPAMGSLEPLPSFYETVRNNGDGDCDKLEQQRRLSRALKSYEREECVSTSCVQF